MSNETETVIKQILPYLYRLGYKEANMRFEHPTKSTEDYSKLYSDILVKDDQSAKQFVIEAKRDSKRLTAKDRAQAISYGKSENVLLAVLTNAKVVEVYNTRTEQPLKWNGTLAEFIPRADQIPSVLAKLRNNPEAENIDLDGDKSLPFRPGLGQKQVNDMFRRCHRKIRSIEKDEEHAFADFSKFIFLKMLEEKADHEDDYDLPYSYRFHELAASPIDQIKTAVHKMLSDQKSAHGDLLTESFYINNAQTYQYIVRELAKVSFADSRLDYKGAAFEYFVRTTLKGRSLGQYFTPRPLVELMSLMVGEEIVVKSLAYGEGEGGIMVLDPACGTGGFLVFMLKKALQQVKDMNERKDITNEVAESLTRRLKEGVFYGADANRSVAATAKMNMIIAGDGHTNIHCEDSLRKAASIWEFDKPGYDLILTNPPFGTSESDSLPDDEMKMYDVEVGKGQYLFLQRMVRATNPGGRIATVIDNGVLNTEQAKDLRKWILERCKVEAVMALPDETFKPNKINVRSSVLLLKRRDHDDVNLSDDYMVRFINLGSLGYQASGEDVRGFDFEALRSDCRDRFLSDDVGEGDHWTTFDAAFADIRADSTDIREDSMYRLDLKYWEPILLDRIRAAQSNGSATIKDLVGGSGVRRGRSPKASQYIDPPSDDEDDSGAHAVVVKAGSCISSIGVLDTSGADWISKDVYDSFDDRIKLQRGDVLVAATGVGTLGKTAVFDLEKTNAIADAHVAIVRADNKKVDPRYLAWFLLTGFGQEQIQRVYTGSTGLIELTNDHLESIVVPLLSSLRQQKELAENLQKSITDFQTSTTEAEKSLEAAREKFRQATAIQE